MAKAVGFTREAAGRIADAVRRVEGMSLGGGVGWHEYRPDDPPSPPRIGKTTAIWNKGAAATIDIYKGSGSPVSWTKTGTQTGVLNQWATVASGKWVAIAQFDDGNWYLTTAEC